MARVLIIDDDGPLRATVARVLRTAGHETLEAEDGEAGVAVVRDTPLDLVITDVMMPRKDGLQAIREIRQLRPDVPIIAVSGSDGAWARAQIFGWTSSSGPYPPLARARMEGVDRTLGKPFDIPDLFAAIREVLGGAADEPVPTDPSPARVTLHVRSGGAGWWTITRDAAPRPFARIADVDEAVFLARRLASGRTRARVVVHNEDETVRALYKYGEE